jgi:HTH-type transcriptional regulator/antitoxin HigA
MIELRPIKTEADYRAALDEIERLFDAQPNTSECDRLEILATLVEAYEKRHYPIEPPEPIEAILYYLETRGLSRHDLEPAIGSQAQVAEVLNRKRALTLEMIQRLHSELGIPAEVLIQPYALVKASA